MTRLAAEPVTAYEPAAAANFLATVNVAADPVTL